MRNWREIKSAIYDALSNYNCEIWYYGPRGKGWGARCAYFEVEINDDYNCDDIEDALANVSDEYTLTIDWDSDEDVDLIACWDSNN